jgi:hypothetical protein
MPAFSLKSLWPATRATLYFVILVAILWSAARMIVGHKHILALYRNSLGSPAAYLYLEALAETLEDHERLVLLVGPSTVREGFDTAVMNERVPGTTFINAGVTSPGTMPHVELLVDIIGWYDIHVDEIVLGLNSRMLAARPSPIALTRYVDVMKYPDGLSYIDFEAPYDRLWALAELDLNMIWPLRRIAIRLDYIIRRLLFKLNQTINWKASLERSVFERGGDPLVNQAGYLYSEQRHQSELLQEHLQKMAARGLLDPARYGGKAQVESMRRTLLKALEVSDHVTVLIMPEHSVVRSGFGAFGDQRFYAVLQEFQSRGVRVIERREFIPDELIRDLAHLVPDGRKYFSREIATALADH